MKVVVVWRGFTVYLSCRTILQEIVRKNVSKHLMTGPKGNSEFCFPETSMFPEAKPRGTLRFEGKQNSLFPEGPGIKCFVIPPDSKLDKN